MREISGLAKFGYFCVGLFGGLFGVLAFQCGDIAKQEADLPASETADAIEAK